MVTASRPLKHWRPVYSYLIVAGLLVGGVVLPFAGWFIAAGALWLAPVWGRREKLVGTFLLPGGFLGVWELVTRPATSTGVCSGTQRSAIVGTLGGSHPAGGDGTVLHATANCFGNALRFPVGVGLALVAVGVLVPLWSAWYLASNARHAPGDEQSGGQPTSVSEGSSELVAP